MVLILNEEGKVGFIGKMTADLCKIRRRGERVNYEYIREESTLEELIQSPEAGVCLEI